MKFGDFFADQNCIVFDGALGTQLYARGIPKGHCYDELNISMPEVVMGIHQEYIDAGAQVITTNTFGANASILEEYYDLGGKVKEINYFGARLAKRIAKKRSFVAGSIGPVTRPLDREKKLKDEDISMILKEQIEALLEGGVDLLLLETFASLDELQAGIRIAREIDKEIVIIAEASFPNNGLTLFGKNPYEAALRLDVQEVDVSGSNCGTGPQSVYEAIRKMGSVTDKELCAMPNAGLAQFTQGKFSYPYNPEYFARYGKKLLASGVRVIGGCCGTTPQHIKLLTKNLEGLTPGRRKTKKIEITQQRQVRKREEITSHLPSLFDRGDAIALEIDPPRDTDFEGFIKKIEPYAEYIDVIHVSDSPMAKPRMSPISAGKLLKDALEKEIVIHYTCRDRNILGIQSDLIGASALGLENVLALGGDPPSIGDYPFATGVYDLTADGLVEMMSALNQGVDLLGNPVGQQTHFFIGIGAGMGQKDTSEIEIVKRKIQHGAHFIVTQPIFDLEGKRDHFEALKKLRSPIVVSIFPLVSSQNAEYVHFEVPGITIPHRYLKRMEGKKGKEGEKEWISIARELLKELRGFANGILLIPPFNRFHLVEEILS
ncbi:MAG: bifunctional homocysteine S-methyltransferase/methylenetetrahydrofolate reductase [Gemmatimonadota bacterium]|nr:MAG: bifunctional homocysteine S-methyltransferase/methylenetetrahydrofolate reductase [Gemmatimonadota bacterium]